MKRKRTEGEIFTYNNKRNYIKIEGKIIPFAHYVAKQNPDICGKWFEGCEVHHINRNSLDDSPENLIVLSEEDHHKVHTTMLDIFYTGDDKIKYIGRFTPEKAEENVGLPRPIISLAMSGKQVPKKYKNWKIIKIF